MTLRTIVGLAVLVTAAAGSTSAASQPHGPQARKPLPPLRMTDRCVGGADRNRVVRFTAPDRTRLIGLALGSGPRGIVLAHQGGGAPPDLCSWLPYARHLVGRGYRVVLFDHRGFGSSGSARTVANLKRVDLDVIAAVSMLRRRGARSVVLMGASLGGTAVVAAGAAIVPRVNGVVTLAGAESYVRIDGIAAARRLTAPALFISAERDFDFPEQARRLYEAAASADKELAIVPGGEHGTPLLRDPAVLARVDAFAERRSLAP